MTDHLEAIRRAVYAGDPTRSPEADVRTLLAEVDSLRKELEAAHENRISLANQLTRAENMCSRPRGTCFDPLTPTAASLAADSKARTAAELDARIASKLRSDWGKYQPERGI